MNPFAPEVPNTADSTPVYHSPLHCVVVQLCLYLLVWPAMAIHAVLTVISLGGLVLLPVALLGWWGLVALMHLHRYFAGNASPPGRATWLGLAVSAALVVYPLLEHWWVLRYTLWYDVLLALIPVAVYWGWLAMKGFQLRGAVVD